MSQPVPVSHGLPGLKRAGQYQSRRLCRHAAFHTITVVAQRFVHKSVHKFGAGTGDFAAIELADRPYGLCLLDEIEPGVDLCDSIGQLDRQPG